MSDSVTHPNQPLKSPERWQAYYNAVAGRPPRETLLCALEKFDAEALPMTPRFAVDLGCGEGRDTVELLQRGWQVLGIDGEAAAIARLLNRPDINPTQLQTQVSRFEVLTLPELVDLINASFSLPFCSPDHFPTLWQTLVRSLRLGGRFCGQLFGDRDSWAANPMMTAHTRTDVETLLRSFDVEFFAEEDHPGETALGETKHWHIFHIVARKNSGT